MTEIDHAAGTETERGEGAGAETETGTGGGEDSQYFSSSILILLLAWQVQVSGPWRPEEVLQETQAVSVLGCSPARVRTHHSDAVQEHAAVWPDPGHPHAGHSPGRRPGGRELHHQAGQEDLCRQHPLRLLRAGDDRLLQSANASVGSSTSRGESLEVPLSSFC